MKFYAIEKNPKGEPLLERYRTDFEFDDSVRRGKAPRCPKCGAFVGMLEALPPYRVHLHTWGEAFGELAFGMNDFLATKRFRDDYTNSSLKGLSEFAPVQVLSHSSHGRTKGAPPDFFRVLPRVGSALIDAKASGIEWDKPHLTKCEVCYSGAGVLRRWRRIVVDEKSWNGDDVFYAYGLPGILLTSERFFQWASVRRFCNLIIRPVDENSHDFYPQQK